MFKIHVMPMIIVIAVFTGIMIPAVMLPLAPNLTIKLLERFRMLQKDEVITTKEMHLDGAGYARNGLVYKYRDPQRQLEFANKKIAVRFFLISIIFCTCLGAITVIIIKSLTF